MPSAPALLTTTGLSSTFGFPMWMPDTDVRPFNIGILVTVNSTAATYNVEHTMDYDGHYSSNFNGFTSSGATWFQNSGINAATSNTQGNYAYPVTAIRLNVTGGSSSGTVTAKFTQAG
jgi:hypothetical protein